MTPSRAALTLLLLLASPAARAHWDDLGTSSDGDKLQVLRGAVGKTGQTGDRRVATLRLVVPAHTRRDPRNDRWVADVVSTWVFDCAKQSGVITESRIHYEDSTSLKSAADNGIRVLSPDSLVYAEMRTACADSHDK